MLTIGINIDEERIEGNLEHLKRDLLDLESKGIDAVELPAHGLDVIRHGRLDRKRLGDVLSMLVDFPFHYSVHAPDAVNIMDRGERQLNVAVFRASLEFACAVRADKVVYHPGRYVPEELFFMGKPMCWSEARKKRLLDIEASVINGLSREFPGVTICMENARPYLFHSPYCYAELLDPLKAQVERIDRDNVKINLDFGHLYLAAKFYDFEAVEAAEAVRELVAHAHIHDNFGLATYYHERRQTRLIPFGRGDCHMPVGWGEIPVEQILSTFLSGYEGLIMMELRGRYFNYVEESASVLRAICDRVLSLPSPATETGGEACTG